MVRINVNAHNSRKLWKSDARCNKRRVISFTLWLWQVHTHMLTHTHTHCEETQEEFRGGLTVLLCPHLVINSALWVASHMLSSSSPCLLTHCWRPRVTNLQTQGKERTESNAHGRVSMLETLGRGSAHPGRSCAPIKRSIVGRKKEKKKKEKEKVRQKKKKTRCLLYRLKMENYCIWFTTSAPSFTPKKKTHKHTHPHFETHTDKPPPTAPRLQHRKWFEWVRSTWWRCRPVCDLVVEMCCTQGSHEPVHVSAFNIEKAATHPFSSLLHRLCWRSYLCFSITAGKCDWLLNDSC